MTSFRFIHAADIHLDSPLRGLARHDGLPAEAMRLATRQALAKLVDSAIKHQVAFMVLAGDLYDGHWKDLSTALFMSDQLRRLSERGISAFIAHGNHDAGSVINHRLPSIKNVHRFPADKPATFTLDSLRVALHGQSFKERHVTDNLAAHYPPAQLGWLNIGVLHTAMVGRENGHEPYAPCTLSDLASHGYDYWALGHVHKAQIVNHPDPWVVYAGVLQGRHARETGDEWTGGNGGWLVSVESGQISACERLYCDVLRWRSLECDLTGCASMEELYERATIALESVLSKAQGRHVVARLNFTGTTTLHNQLHADQDWQQELRLQARQCSYEGQWLALEKITLHTHLPSSNTAKALQPGLAMALGRLAQDPGQLEQCWELLRPLSKKLQSAGDAIPQLAGLPTGTPGEMDTIMLEGDFKRLVHEATEELLAQLAMAGGTAET
ncbi:DNA repair exonuclease [Formicincola oecophyllae]|uniref:DNA repair exonuclease n=1 Tax=Formicincola oecophyllae TaxID=2558361 RepID=A0A4Y6UAP4_9PROT|nr:DNA repair exonuclease [Formicincola oecophyllae]QDH13536.1 DNA repair exonuclease [Formicincola oecophyllae]